MVVSLHDFTVDNIASQPLRYLSSVALAFTTICDHNIDDITLFKTSYLYDEHIIDNAKTQGVQYPNKKSLESLMLYNARRNRKLSANTPIFCQIIFT